MGVWLMTGQHLIGNADGDELIAGDVRPEGLDPLHKAGDNLGPGGRAELDLVPNEEGLGNVELEPAQEIGQGPLQK